MRTFGWRRAIARILLALLLLLIVYVVYSGWRTYGHVRALRTHLWQLKTLALKEPAAVGASLHAIQADVASLRRDLALYFAIAPHLERLPGVGPTLAAVGPLLDAGEVLLHAGVTTFDTLQEPLAAALAGTLPPQEALAALSQRIAAHREALAGAVAEAQEGLNALQQLDTARLLPPLREPLRCIRPLVPLISAAWEGLLLWPDLLAPQGEHTYLLLAQNNQELRPTGGFISSIGVLTLQDGLPTSFTLQDSYQVENWDAPHPDPPDPLRRHMQLDLWVTRDANWWPDYPTSAQAVAELYTLNQGRPVDGVIALDMIAAVQLLEALTPLTLPDGRRVERGQVAETFARSWSLPEGSLGMPGGIIIATRPFSDVQVALTYHQRQGRAWFDSVSLVPLEAPETNLVRNPSCEEDADGDGLPDGWVAEGLAAGDGLVTDHAHSGQRALYLAGEPAADKGVSQRLGYAGRAGTAFRLSAQSRSQDTPTRGGDYGLTVTFFAADGSTETVRAGFPALTHDWATAGSDVVLSHWWRHRKDFMNELLAAALRAMLIAPQEVDWLALLTTLQEMLAQRHLQVYLTSPAMQAWVARHGWAGAMADAPGDYLLVVDSNVGYNKVSASVQEALDYRVAIPASGLLRARLTIRYHNDSRAIEGPCDKYRQYLPTYEALTQGCYWDYVRVYAPQGAQLIAGGGGDEPVTVAEELGRTVFSTALVLSPGERRELTFDYHLPRAVLQEGRYELYVQKQAGTEKIPLRVQITAADSLALTPQGGLQPGEVLPSILVYRSDLLVDRQLSVGLAP